MKLIPRAASAFVFHNPPDSPGRVVSGPIKNSITPQESWTKSNNSGFETPEPISPKVSCIGRIKNRKKIKEPAKSTTTAAVEIPDKKKRRPPSAIKKMLTGGKVHVRDKLNVVAAPVGNRRCGGKPPRLNQMKRFTSGRGGPLANFDWTARMIVGTDVEEEELDGGGGRSPVWIGEEGGPLQPRKEVNIWKRRTVVPPTPLQLNFTIVKQKS